MEFHEQSVERQLAELHRRLEEAAGLANASAAVVRHLVERSGWGLPERAEAYLELTSRLPPPFMDEGFGTAFRESLAELLALKRP